MPPIDLHITGPAGRRPAPLSPATPRPLPADATGDATGRAATATTTDMPALATRRAMAPGKGQSPALPGHHPTSDRPRPITGTVYALRDGSGYVTRAGDGHYYRVEGGRGQGLIHARTGGGVDESLVDVGRGPVSAAQLQDLARDERLRLAMGLVPRAEDDDHEPPPRTARNDLDGKAGGRQARPSRPDTAAGDTRRTRALIDDDPQQAIAAQANLAGETAVSLLDD